ncbi:MAG TPA: alpha/beta hydrolase [Candidatus Krumholzibacteria bacterium]|nr:alpha/beta hydrolase [Candidatus Krumholzibacteria bacterium]HRX52319.1 alpha/beta hydrolase [Candidatus Krumholzibacteria bacterium]
MKSLLTAALLLTLALPLAAAQPAYDARLSGYAYPFPVRIHSLSSQGQELEMAYMTLEAGADAPWAVLLHGKNFNGAYWAETARFLQARGWNVLMPDQVGFGKSSKPDTYQYSFAALAANTAGLLDALGIGRAVVVGHSMGGMLASRFALQHPERTVELILINPIGLENYLEFVEYRDPAFFEANEKALTAEKIRAYQQANYYDGAWSERYAALTEPLVGWVQGPDRDLIARVNARTYDMIFTQPVVTEFQDLTVPVSLILGTRDRTGPGRGWKRPDVTRELGRYDRLGLETLARIPHAELFQLEGLGHLPQIEDFAGFSEALVQALP